MGRYARQPSGGGDYEQPDPGTYVGVCFRICDLGTQHSDFNGEERIVNQILVSWELPGELMKDGRPFAVSKFFTNSLHEKATLRKDLAAWRGRDFTESELEAFDLASILGKACLVSVVLSTKGKSKVQAVLALPKGTPAPKATNELQSFFLDEYDEAVWETIPKGIRGIIQKSEEYQAMNGGGAPHEEDEPPVPISDEDDIPF